jgi:hypothetical protein
MTVLAMQVNATISTEREVRFDTDSATIGIDNRCSVCISHCKEDFEPGTLKRCNRVVKGFGGSRVTNVQIGTIRWSWEDDNGVIYDFLIPNSYYVPDGKMRLLSPQHWAQTQSIRAQRVDDATNAPTESAVSSTGTSVTANELLTSGGPTMWPHSHWPRATPTLGPSAAKRKWTYSICFEVRLPYRAASSVMTKTTMK